MGKNNDNKTPIYGDKRHYFELAWHDESKRDDLVIVNTYDMQEIMNQRAKGTTIYELINLYGGIDSLTEAYAEREKNALYDDISDYPEMANDESYMALLNRLQSQIDELKKAKENEVETESTTETTKETTEGGNQNA